MQFVFYIPKFPENPEPNRTNRDLGRCCSVSSRCVDCSSRFGLGGQQIARSRSRSWPRSKNPARYRFEPPNRYRAPSSLSSFAGLIVSTLAKMDIAFNPLTPLHIAQTFFNHRSDHRHTFQHSIHGPSHFVAVFVDIL